MRTSLALAVGQLAVLSKKEEAVEIAIVAAVVILLVLVLVLYWRSRRKSRPGVTATSPAVSAQSPLDVGQALQATTPVAPLGPADPLDTLGAPSSVATITEDPPAAASETPAPFAEPVVAPDPAPVAEPVVAAHPAPAAGPVEASVGGEPTAPVSVGTADAPPAGWLPDPSGIPDTLRYWDGVAWTAHVAQRV